MPVVEMFSLMVKNIPNVLSLRQANMLKRSKQIRRGLTGLGRCAEVPSTSHKTGLPRPKSCDDFRIPHWKSRGKRYHILSLQNVHMHRWTPHLKESSLGNKPFVVFLRRSLIQHQLTVVTLSVTYATPIVTFPKLINF